MSVLDAASQEPPTHLAAHCWTLSHSGVHCANYWVKVTSQSGVVTPFSRFNELAMEHFINLCIHFWNNLF